MRSRNKIEGTTHRNNHNGQFFLLLSNFAFKKLSCDSVVEGGNSVQLIDTGVDIVENVHNVKCSWTSQGVNANADASVGGTGVQQR